MRNGKHCDIMKNDEREEETGSENYFHTTNIGGRGGRMGNGEVK